MIPKRYLKSYESDKLSHEIDIMTDWFGDELFDCGREEIIFPVSRLLCDAERFRDDKDEIMAQVGMGAIYTRCSDGSRLRAVSETEKRDILARFYDAHHVRFTKAVEQRLEKYGKCLIIDGHSFYPEPLPHEPDQSLDRPDFCIGTSDYHTPEVFTDKLVRRLSERGYSVNVDSPFAGTIVPMEFYEKDPRVISVMIEVNRRLYSDAPGVKSERFPKIRSVLSDCIDIIEELSGH